MLLTAIPVAAKWLLIGRFKPEVIPGLEPRLFPLLGGEVADALRAARVFVGTPLYNFYLRLLGARIGAGTRAALPLPAGLHRSAVDRGAGTILRTDCFVPGYKAQANRIHTGPVAHRR